MEELYCRVFSWAKVFLENDICHALSNKLYEKFNKPQEILPTSTLYKQCKSFQKLPEDGNRKKFCLKYAKAILKKHLQLPPKFNTASSVFKNLSDVNKQLIKSLQNRGRFPNVLKFQEREGIFRDILCQYNPNAILMTYINPQNLFNRFTQTQDFEIQNLEFADNVWSHFAKGIVSGSQFLSKFQDIQEFENFIKFFQKNQDRQFLLPEFLKYHIEEMGLALACDFLKELGYTNYPKPDTHLIEIFSQLELSTKKSLDVGKSICEMAKVVKKDVYTVDRIFWLIASGNFFLDKIVVGSKRSGYREAFIRKVQKNQDYKKAKKALKSKKGKK